MLAKLEEGLSDATCLDQPRQSPNTCLFPGFGGRLLAQGKWYNRQSRHLTCCWSGGRYTSSIHTCLLLVRRLSSYRACFCRPAQPLSSTISTNLHYDDDFMLGNHKGWTYFHQLHGSIHASQSVREAWSPQEHNGDHQNHLWRYLGSVSGLVRRLMADVVGILQWRYVPRLRCQRHRWTCSLYVVVSLWSINGDIRRRRDGLECWTRVNLEVHDNLPAVVYEPLSPGFLDTSLLTPIGIFGGQPPSEAFPWFT